MKREKIFFRIIYAYIILVFFYGIVIKATVNLPLLFSLKTYLPEILIGIAASLYLTNKKNWMFTKFEFVGIVYFLTVIIINCVTCGFSNDALYCFRDIYIPIFACLIYMKIDFSSKALEKFYRFILIISMIYLVSGAILGIVEVMNGWDWTSKFYTGYSFYDVDAYSKVKISEASGQLRAPGLTGNSVSFSYYGLIAIIAILNKKDFNPVFKTFFFVSEIIILFCTLNKTTFIILGIIALYYLFNRLNKVIRNILLLVIGIIALSYIVMHINNDIFYSVLDRFRFWGTLDSYVNPLEVLVPYNSFSYNPGAEGILSFWDNTYLFFLFSIGIFGTVWVYFLSYKLKKRGCIVHTNMKLFFNYLYVFMMLSSLFNNITSGRAYFGLYLLIGAIYYKSNVNATNNDCKC